MLPARWVVLAALAMLVFMANGSALPVAANGGTVVSISPTAQNVNVGGTAVVNVFVAGVSNLYGAEIHLTFDQTLLAVQDADGGTPGIQITPGPLLTGGTFTVATNQADNSIGNIDFAITQVNPTAAVSGSGVVATIRFTGIAPGMSAVHFVTSGPLPSHLSDRNGFAISATFQDGSITVLGGSNPILGESVPAEVPEADTLLLFGTGGTSIATYLLWQWRRRRA